MNVGPLCDDFLAEREELLGLLEPLDDDAWSTPTPAPGWSVLDQVTHLAFFDQACRQSIVAPDEFRLTREAAMADVDGFVDGSTRVPWYGPDMSLASSMTAWIMDTWAHGQDVVDALHHFCLVVTQRRHVGDTALVVEGPVATEWLSIAQAFAGPLGPGPTPGQFG